MKKLENKVIYIILAVAAGVFLWIHYATHIEFLLHLAAIPLETLVVVSIVEKILDNRATAERRRQLMYIKSCMFRDQMRSLFLTNIAHVEYPVLKLSELHDADLDTLKELRATAEDVRYHSLKDMETVITEYVTAEPIWQRFLEIAITYNFESIIRDMTNIQHFIQDVKVFKRVNPDQLFIQSVAADSQAMGRVNLIIGDGIRKFLDYLIELKEKQPEMFRAILDDYEISSRTVECGCNIR